MYILLLAQKCKTSSIGNLFVYAQYFVVWKRHENQPPVTFSSSLAAGKYYYMLLDLNYIAHYFSSCSQQAQRAQNNEMFQAHAIPEQYFIYILAYIHMYIHAYTHADMYTETHMRQSDSNVSSLPPYTFLFRINHHISKPLNILDHILLITTVSLDRWQHHC
jgi:hypothetical protein